MQVRMLKTRACGSRFGSAAETAWMFATEPVGPDIPGGRNMIRALAIATVLGTAILLLPQGSANAQAARWCAVYSNGAGTNCGFNTYRQCRADISGVGGYCRRN